MPDQDFFGWLANGNAGVLHLELPWDRSAFRETETESKAEAERQGADTVQRSTVPTEDKERDK